jgi:hypothetical protein
MTTALVVSAKSASDEAVSKTLAQVPPWSLMITPLTPALRRLYLCTIVLPYPQNCGRPTHIFNSNKGLASFRP